MTIKSWKEEFYPITAGKLSASKPTELEAIDHSLKKWTGLTKENLLIHNLFVSGKHVIDRSSYEKFIVADGDSCSLCCVCYEKRSCKKCPLYKIRGEQCDNDVFLSKSPYVEYLNSGNPTRMIRLLKFARLLAVIKSKLNWVYADS